MSQPSKDDIYEYFTESEEESTDMDTEELKNQAFGHLLNILNRSTHPTSKGATAKPSTSKGNTVYDQQPHSPMSYRPVRNYTGTHFIHQTASTFRFKSSPPGSTKFVMWIPVQHCDQLKKIDLDVNMATKGMLVIEWDIKFIFELTLIRIEVTPANNSATAICNQTKRLDGYDGFFFNVAWNSELDELDTEWILKVELSPSLIIDEGKSRKSSRSFKHMLDWSILSDFVIKTKDESFNCHKVLLANQSDYFLSMFESDMKEARENVLDWTDRYDATTVKAMLHYMYTDKQPPTLEIVYLELFELAHLCMVEGLKPMCISAMKQLISVDNVVAIIQIAIKYEQKYLQRHAFKFFVKTYEQLKVTQDWIELDAEQKSFILDAAFTFLEEYKLLY